MFVRFCRPNVLTGSLPPKFSLSPSGVSSALGGEKTKPTIFLNRARIFSLTGFPDFLPVSIRKSKRFLPRYAILNTRKIPSVRSTAFAF